MEKQYDVSLVKYYRVTVNGKTSYYSDMVDIGEGYKKILKNAKWGVLNPKGRVICSMRYKEVFKLKDGMIRIYNGEKYGYVCIKTGEVWPCIFEQADDFENGTAKVVFEGRERYISKQCQFVDSI